jgi:hypothetical protein
MSNVIQIIQPAGVIDTLTGNTGGTVGPTGNNINILGIDGITVMGDPLSSTLYISGSGGGSLTITGDSGGAVPPSSSNWTFTGAGGLTISGNPGTGTLTFTQTAGGITAVDSGDNITVNTVGTVATVNLNESILQPPTNGSGSEGIYALGTTDVVTDRFLHNYGTNNTFLGYGSGNLTLIGTGGNTCVGRGSGQFLSSGAQNAIFGASSGLSLTSGSENSFYGFGAATALVSGNRNVVIGNDSLFNATSSVDTVAIGKFALFGIANGDRNCAIGSSSGKNMTGTPSDNIFIGYESAYNYLTSESDNIIIGNPGVVADAGVIRIGVENIQNTAYMAGIYGNTVGMTQGLVIVDNTGKLGSISAGGFASIFDADSGSAVPLNSTITMAGGSNINTSAAGSTVTFNLDDTVSISGSMTAGTGLTATTGGVTTTGTNTFNSLGAGVMQTSSAGVISSSNGSNGQLLIGGGSAPAWANITSTDGSVTVTNGANTIDLSVEGSIIPGCRVWYGVASGGSNVPVYYECTSSVLTSVNGAQVLTLGPAFPSGNYLVNVFSTLVGAKLIGGVPDNIYYSSFSGTYVIQSNSLTPGLPRFSMSNSTFHRPPTGQEGFAFFSGNNSYVSATVMGIGNPWQWNFSATFSITTI